MEWLKYNFDDKMNWDNYGSYWHIDHVIPCAHFDFTKEEDIKTCFIWTNLRPLEGKENNSKKDKIIPEEIEKQKNQVSKFLLLHPDPTSTIINNALDNILDNA